MTTSTPLLESVTSPEGIRTLDRQLLPQLAGELRNELISCVAETGGHLGAGLGVVELTVALHAVFDTPRDILIWDVGHQAYPHKIMTERRDRMRTLRQGGGLSGFTKRAESPYDPFGAAHAATSISAALGFCVARDQRGENQHVVAVIGDGSLSAGMAYEALNCAVDATKRLIVVVNDNAMSIAPPVGAMSRYLARRTSNRLFAHLGFRYFGPVDGHDVLALTETLSEAAKETAQPVVVHVKTRKGKGYTPAEAAKDCYHGVSPFDVASGVQKKGPPGPPSYTEIFARCLSNLADHDPAIVAITAAMPSGTGLDKFAQRHPPRMFDVGIAEQHAVTFAAGLAAAGMKPFAAIYSTFLQRGYDQVVHDVALQSLPVRFAIDRAGLVGADGATHAGAFDIGYLGALPGFVVMAAADELELTRMVATCAAIDDRPSAVRYPRGAGIGLALPDRVETLEIGRGRIIREGTRVAFLSLGNRLRDVLDAAETLGEAGISATVADARFAKPLDMDLITRLARNHQALITVEEGAMGGFGAFVLQALARDGHLDRGLRVRTLTLPDLFQDHDLPDRQIVAAGLDASSLVQAALAATGTAGRPALKVITTTAGD